MPTSQPSRQGAQQPAARPVSLILVVKGAGNQRPDDTLDLFVQGFWPAVRGIDARATMRERSDVFPAGYRCGAHDAGEHNHLTEIAAAGRCIWIREVNWEPGLRASAPVMALGREWRMASWAYLFEVHKWIASVLWSQKFKGAVKLAFQDERAHQDATEEQNSADSQGGVPGARKQGANEDPVGGREAGREAREEAVLREALASLEDASPSSGLYPLTLFAALLITHLGVFMMVALVIAADASGGAQVSSLTTQGFNAGSGALQGVVALMILAALASVPVAARIRAWHRRRAEDALASGLAAILAIGGWSKATTGAATSALAGLAPQVAARRSPTGPPPALTNFILLILLAAFLYSPVNYLAVLGLLLALQAALLVIRGLLWPWRPFEPSDIETRWAGTLDPEGPRANLRLSPTIRFPLFLYRGIVAMALPFFFVALGIAAALKWTRIFHGVGDALERMLSAMLGGIMGDVVTYAMDASQATRIRSEVEGDLRLLAGREEVEDVHIVAHSQGTPITFELLYRHGAAELREKLRTYLTIGSVLSYYHHADPVLDPGRYDQRFPPPAYPDDFPEAYRWYNCWNLTDPITEFYGLDEYLQPKVARTAASPLDLVPPDPNRMANLHPASPVNIKTPASLKNHSAYWSQLESVLDPLARRVLNGDAGWPRDRWEGNTGRVGHTKAVFLLHLAATAALIAAWAVLLGPTNQAWGSLTAWVATLGRTGGSSGPVAGTIQDLQTALSWLARPEWKKIRVAILTGATLAAVPAAWLAWAWEAGRSRAEGRTGGLAGRSTPVDSVP